MDLSLESSHLQDYSKWLQQSQDDNDGHFRNFSLWDNRYCFDSSSKISFSFDWTLMM